MFRLNIYSQFADQANKSKLSWCVLHGDEGYPDTIGRDLDITCASYKDQIKLIELFKKCLNNEDECKWIIEPDPIWGPRILGISSDFDVAELHIIRPIRSFIISLEYSKDRIKNKRELFIHDELLYFFKGSVMPSLNGSFPKEVSLTDDRNLPWWLLSYSSALQNGKISLYDRLSLYLKYFISHPVSAISNLIRWSRTKISIFIHPATPVFYIDSKIKSDDFIKCIRDNLGRVFFDVVDGSGLSNSAIQKMRATQRLVFSKHKERETDSFISKKLFDNKEMLFPFILESFKKFNGK